MTESLPDLFAGLSADRREQIIGQLSEDEARELQRQIHAQDPIAFVLDTFGPGYLAETGKPLELDKWQTRALRYLVRHEPHDACDGAPAKRLGVRAAKGPGKSALEAWIIWWFYSTRRFANIAAMAITADNLRDNLWKELATWYSRAPSLQSEFQVKGERIVPRNVSSDIEKRWFVSARSFPQKPDKQQQAASAAGLHSDHVAVLIDEGGDVPPGILAAAEGIFANTVDALVVIDGNCNSVDGALYDATVRRGHRYHVVRITGDPDDPERSPRMDLQECRDLIADYGRTDPVVMINVLGEFPLTAINKLLSPDQVSIAERRKPDLRLMQQEPNIYGLDIARHGLDVSALTRRQGPVAFMPQPYRIDDLMALADQVAFVLSNARPAADALIVGATGLGWGVVDRLRQLGWGHLLIALDEGTPARSPEFHDIRTEMWFNMAGWVKSRGCLPESPELRADLLAPGARQRFLRGATREILDPVEFIKQTLGRSPDRGTSLALTFAAPIAPRGLYDAQHAQRTAKTDFDPFAHLRK